jgi:hypothetical protein
LTTITTNFNAILYFFELIVLGSATFFNVFVISIKLNGFSLVIFDGSRKINRFGWFVYSGRVFTTFADNSSVNIESIFTATA